MLASWVFIRSRIAGKVAIIVFGSVFYLMWRIMSGTMVVFARTPVPGVQPNTIRKLTWQSMLIMVSPRALSPSDFLIKTSTIFWQI